MTINPVKDRVAVVGVGSTGFQRDSDGRSRNALLARACIDAIHDAGLGAEDIDGICGTVPSTAVVADMLGLPRVTYYVNQAPPIGFSLIDAVNAVFAGAARTVLVYHPMYRSPVISRSAANDPLRRHLGFAGASPPAAMRHDPEDVAGSVGYTAWASGYLAEHGIDRRYLGYVVLNGRSNATRNPLAAMRTPLTMTDYLAARMIRDPLCLLDMDVPVDGADAFVLTSIEHARDLPHRPVLVHAATAGLTAPVEEDQIVGLHQHGQHVVVEELRAKSDLWLPDVDVYFPYDGFSFLTLSWLEAVGWCQPGEAGPFLEQHWDTDRNAVLIDGRVPLNPHGGALSEGGTQGSGHLREAVVQLRGDAGERQTGGARAALLTLGGFFYNAQGIVLRVE